MKLMSLINYHTGLVGLCFYDFIESKWAISMYFECFSGKALFGLHFRIDLKIFSFLRLFFMLDPIRRIIDSVNWFIYVTWLIDLGL